MQLTSLTVDEIDDLLYFTRVNEVQYLRGTINELTKKYQCQPKHILGAAVDPESANTVLHYCAANGFADLLNGFFADLSGAGYKPGQKLDPVPELLNRGNGQGNTPLHWAAYNGQLDVVKALVTAGADMWMKNAAGHLAMFEAERADMNDVVQYLLEAGGKEVEKAGAERQPSAEDVADVQDGEAGRPNGNGQAFAGADTKMSDAGLAQV